jgi:2'-5' RNA ligase
MLFLRLFEIISHMDDEPYQEIYFIGIALPMQLSQRIADLAWDLYEHKSDMLKPLVPHVTLLHPPSLRGIMPSEFVPRVREVAARYVPLNIELTDVGFFGEQVCYVRAESHALFSLQSQLVELLPPEAQELHYKRPYLPHITIAQKYQPEALDVEAVRQKVCDTLQFPIQFEVTSLSCFTRIKPREYAEKPIE